jgi:transposase
LAELQSFAAGVEKDKAAVKAGLTWSINNGQVEGHVTKLKLMKRTMYGQVGFPLLRKPRSPRRGTISHRLSL